MEKVEETDGAQLEQYCFQLMCIVPKHVAASNPHKAAVLSTHFLVSKTHQTQSDFASEIIMF